MQKKIKDKDYIMQLKEAFSAAGQDEADQAIAD
jgi:hypothetical protein